MSVVTFRPPLWSQEGSYSAADDRTLIESIWTPGIVEISDLRVMPRQEGANLSVDVLPGTIIVKGTEQADQGSYLCRLAQRVNVPLTAGPGAGNARTDRIIARVYEPVSAEAYWRVEVHSSNVGPSGQAPTFPPLPPSSQVLALVGPVISTTNQITASLIRDARAKARAFSVPVVTELPAAPNDGYEVYYQVTVGTYWYLRYFAPAGRWVFLGGSPLHGSGTSGTGGPQNVWTMVYDPALTVPLYGQYAYDWSIGGRVRTPATLPTVQAGFGHGGTHNPMSVVGATVPQADGSYWRLGASSVQRWDLAAGQTSNLFVYQTSGNLELANWWLTLTPVWIWTP